MSPIRSRKLTRSLLAAGAIASAVAFTACSAGPDAGTGGGSGEAADLTAAQALVDEMTAEVTELNIPDASPAIAQDKLLVTIPCSAAAAGCVSVTNAAEEAAKQLGWEVKMIDPAGDPEKTRQAVRQAMQLGADGIIFGAAVADTVKDDVADARAAGIKVVETLEPPTEDFADGSISNDRTKMGETMAAYLTVATEGEGNIIVVSDPAFPSTRAQVEGFENSIGDLCGTCTVAEKQEFQIINLQTEVPQQFQTALQKHPDANAVWVPYDPVYAAIEPVIQRSSNPDGITVVSANGDDFALEALKGGDTNLGATIAYPNAWFGYAAVDLMNRLFSGEEIPDDVLHQVLPVKLITSENVTTVPWDGDVDWQGAYEKNWNAAK